jgi:protein gp37
MADNSKIEWTEASWNPVTGCTKVSPGCDHCYAETFAERWRGTKGHAYEHGFDLTLRPERLDQPLRWKRPRRIFVNSMSDLFHDDVPDEFIADVWHVMAETPQHTYQILTKRHARLRSWVSKWCSHPSWTTPLPNVWLGVSVENQQWADIRIPALFNTPAAVRWLSCEPLLGPVNLWHRMDPADPNADCTFCGAGWWDDEGGHPLFDEENEDTGQWCLGPMQRHAHINWVVVGGESGPGARPMHPDWARTLRDQCTAAGVPYFFKQWGEWAPAVDLDPDRRERAPEQLAGQEYVCRVGKRAAGRELDGRTWDEYPAEAMAS